MKKFFMAATLSLPLITACDNNSIATIDGEDVSPEQFKAYLDLKRIPATDAQVTARHVDQYVERNALVAAIDKTDRINSELIKAELNDIRSQLIIGKYFDDYLNDLVTDESLENHYKVNIKDYQTRQVKVAHILLRVNKKMQDTERQAILTTAMEVHSKLQTGEGFGELAQRYSEDKVSAQREGSLGWIVEGAIDRELSAKAFSMAPGEYSEPFLTSYGFHILKVLEEPQVRTKSFDSVKGEIRHQLKSQAKKAEIDRLLSTVSYSIK